MPKSSIHYEVCTLESLLFFSEMKLVLQEFVFNKIDSVRNIFKKAIRPSHA